ncbi:putative integral membrane protein (TIGR02206 family) [Bacillus ectoiniformans]|uniref:YwaF family protein n=1 Tax=Bacillus ectoiniformans TaxID=1494429 RepID=UPI0019577C30|nr:TIGR02206 family membrane protein [Bacillus ectoiniformans]MBM7649228.1 putative integral membrane protein (TIGR02206 family) [Bacillus ectoiniformans]
MGWFSGSYDNYQFTMFAASHLAVIVLLIAAVIATYYFRHSFSASWAKTLERLFALSILSAEGIYHIWMRVNDDWRLSHALPLELCSISLFLTAALLLTRKKIYYEIVLFTGLLGASQALFTPFLHFDFPHFRYFHFFFTHVIIFWTPLYFTWTQGYRPTIYSVAKFMIFLQLLMPIILLVNKTTGGNYMFLSHKPESASLLNILGPYPFYILSLEMIALSLSLLIWVVFKQRSRQSRTEQQSYEHSVGS